MAQQDPQAPRRKGAVRRSDIPADVLRALNEGREETITLVEWLAIDVRVLLRAIIADVGLDEVRAELKTEAERLAAMGVTERLRGMGAVLFEVTREHANRLQIFEKDCDSYVRHGAGVGGLYIDCRQGLAASGPSGGGTTIRCRSERCRARDRVGLVPTIRSRRPRPGVNVARRLGPRPGPQHSALRCGGYSATRCVDCSYRRPQRGARARATASGASALGPQPVRPARRRQLAERRKQVAAGLGQGRLRPLDEGVAKQGDGVDRRARPPDAEETGRSLRATGGGNGGPAAQYQIVLRAQEDSILLTFTIITAPRRVSLGGVSSYEYDQLDS